MNGKAVEKTLKAMRAAGFIEPVDEALVEAIRGVARAVDSDPANASLWREYRALLADLRELGDGDSDAFTELLASLRAPVRDS